MRGRGSHSRLDHRKKKHIEELEASIVEAGKIMRGARRSTRVFAYTPLDVKRIRRELFKKSQGEFAAMLGFSVNTLQDWEQGRRRPSGPARALLLIAAKHPRIIAAALAS